MKLIDYLKDRFPVYLAAVLAWLLILVFMSAYHNSVQEIIIIGLILLISVMIEELWNFFRKKSYYDKLLNCLNELDKKYLISEMAENPDFYDGKLLYQVICEADKSMCEHIAEYRHQSEDFREYIELWVHEIKIPVASLQLMCHNDGNHRYSEQLKRIDSYIENVLYYARSENAEKDYIIKEISLKRVFADTAIRNRESLQEQNVSIRTENLDISIMTDGKWLEYILSQLMSNSLKYFSPEREPEIFVYAKNQPDRVLLHFRDNGIGIPEQDLSRIFDKSFTGENGHHHAKSTGMGLYIVKKLCDKLGHNIKAEAVQGEYTDIIITFGKDNFHQF